MGIRTRHSSLASICSTVAARATGPPQGSRFITPMQAPVRHTRILVSMFIRLYTGYMAGIVMRTVVAVVPSMWAMVAMMAVATVTAMTLLPATLTRPLTMTSNIPVSDITPK